MALCKLFAVKADMLLLDEPTNHLDAESVEWLEQYLLRFPGTVVAVTRPLRFLDNAAGGSSNSTAATAFPGRQLLELAGAEEARLETEGQADRRP